MKKVFLHFALLLLISSCSLREDSIVVSTNDSDPVENKILNEAINLRSSLFGNTTKSLQGISVTELRPRTKSSSISSYVVNYQNEGGYAVITTDGEDITTVAITSGGYLNPTFLQDAIDNVENTTFTYNEGVAESPQDFEYGDEYIQPYPMDPLPYEEDLINNTEPLPNDHPSIRFIAETLVYLDNFSEDSILGQQVDRSTVPVDSSLIGVWTQTAGVAPLIKTKWGQRGVYQQACPIMPDGNKALVGCVGIAAGQITAYLAPPHLNYDWNRLVNIGNKDDRYATNASNEDKELVANYLRFVADAVSTNYGSDGSSSNISYASIFYRENVLLNNVSIYDYDETMSFRSRMMERLQYHLPIHIRSSSDDGGHAFIIDGYMTQVKYITTTMGALRDVFHINWGWYGSGDGYYMMPNLNSRDRVGYDSETDPGNSAGLSNARDIRIITYSNPSWRFSPIQL